jgi:acetylglutamate kinase
MSTTVVKLGGALLADPAALAAVWGEVAGLRKTGPVILVHGGGTQVTSLARRLGHEPRIVAGRRVTTDIDLDAILQILRGQLNTRLVATARAAGIPAVGLSGVDGGLVRVERRPPQSVAGEVIDFGHVGDVAGCDPAVLHTLIDAGFVPVVASPCADAAGNLYNVNADTVALTLADALGADHLLLVAEAGGVFEDLADARSRIAEIDAGGFEAGVAAGWIVGGMRPKLEVGFEARRRGVPHVRICAPAGLTDSLTGTTLR